MKKFKLFVEEIDVSLPHTNAERLETATVYIEKTKD